MEEEWWVGEVVTCKGCGATGKLTPEDEEDVTIQKKVMCRVVSIPCFKKCGSIMKNFHDTSDVLKIWRSSY